MMKENQPTPLIDTNQYRGILPSRSAQLTETQWYAKTSSVLLIVGAILSVLTWITVTVQSFVQAYTIYGMIEYGSDPGHVYLPILTPLFAIVMIAVWVGMQTGNQYEGRRNTLAIGIVTFVALLFSSIESLFWSSVNNWGYAPDLGYTWVRDMMKTVQNGIGLIVLVVFALLIAYIVCYINERRRESLFQQQVVKGEMNE